MTKIFFFISMTTITLAGFLMLYFIYLTFWPINVVTLNKPLSLVPATVKAGDSVYITMDFTKHKDIKPAIKYYLNCDGYSEPLTQDGTNRPVQRNVVTIVKVIPIETNSTDNCTIQIDLSYPVTPFRSINYSWKTNTFKITDAE